ncbi:MAG: PaaI family thioesterase [Deltaproteobacteria bacterium]
MSRSRPEPVEVIKGRRDAALAALVGRVPYIQFLGVQFDRRGDELTALLPYQPMLIGNPALPALHGGATSAFLEITSVIELSWSMLWDGMETTGTETLPKMPKTIDFTVDFLRSGLPRDVYARARVNRSGRRFASVHVEAWQDNKARPMAQATGHFLMP